MMRAVALIILLGNLISPADATECRGVTPRKHAVQLFDFSANSWSEKCAGSDYYCYFSCLKNEMIQGDLRLHWYIPGQQAWLPAGVAETQVRFGAGPGKIVNGTCIEYGYNSKKVFTPLVIGNFDGARFAYQFPECLNIADDYAHERDGVGSRLPIKQEIELFFPSDSKRPHGTLLRLTGIVNFSADDKEQTIMLSYNVQRYEGRAEGVPGDVSWRVGEDASDLKFTGTGLESPNTRPQAHRVKLGEKGTVRASGAVRGNTLHNLFFRLFDRSGDQVAQVFLPMLR